jgi:rhomboid family protein
MIPIRDTIPTRRIPFVTWLIIVANALVFWQELSLSEHQLTLFVTRWAFIPAQLFDPQDVFSVGFVKTGLLPLFSAIFLHGGWLHFIGNMWVLFIFGDNVEDRMGHTRYVIFYVISGILANGVHALLNMKSTAPTLGASGAIAGIMGAYFILYPLSRVLVLVPIIFYPLFAEVPAVFYLFIWFAIQVFSGATTLIQGQDSAGGVAFWAHIGGFIAGIALLMVMLPRKKRKPNRWG